MEQLIPVTIIIGDRNYRLKVSPNDEEVLRKTVKLINEKLIEFKTQFAGKDMQDYVSMVLLWFATEQNVSVNRQMQEETLSDALQNIERSLDQVLKNPGQ